MDRHTFMSLICVYFTMDLTSASLLTPMCISLQLKPERVAARQLIGSHDPEAVVADRHNWMIVLVPERPVAGERCRSYHGSGA